MVHTSFHMSSIYRMMYDTAINAVDCGDEASVWISQYLCGTSEGIRLGYFMEDFCTRLNPLEYFSKKNIDILSFYENMRKADSVSISL